MRITADGIKSGSLSSVISSCLRKINVESGQAKNKRRAVQVREIRSRVEHDMILDSEAMKLSKREIIQHGKWLIGKTKEKSIKSFVALPRLKLQSLKKSH